MDAATVVWVAPQAPDDAQQRALAAWARAHDARLAAPRDESPPVLAVDLRIADEVEQQLDRARDAIAARDGDAVDAALAAAESRLRAHPELPQASWLMAEVERSRSTRFRRLPPVDAEAADRAWMRAEALDGGRVAGAGEQAAAGHAQAATVTLELGTSAIANVVRVDGIPAVPGPLATRAGPHTIVVSSLAGPVWAAWIDAPAGASTVHVGAPTGEPCSSGDVARVRVQDGAVVADGVRCPGWVAAMPAAAGTAVLVTSCEGDHCGPLLEWRAQPAWAWVPPPEHVNHPWPAWLKWTLVGAGAAVVAVVVVVASGVLQPAPQQTRFVIGPPNDNR